MEQMAAKGYETQTLDAVHLKINACTGCGHCETKGVCIFKDEFTNIFLPAIADADIIVISSPVYFYGFPAKIKALIDRIQVMWSRRYRLKTKPNRSYSVEGFQPKYIPEIEFFDTNDSGNIEFNIELEIESYKDAEEIVTDDDEGNTFIELENIYFDFAKWDIKPQAARTLDVLVELLKKYPRMEIQLGAHTDSRSTYEFNMDLSQKRAIATLEYLVKNGITRARLSSKGYGETKPLVPCGANCTETEFSINRRCEFLILR